jgi:hypothetical protein
VIASRLVSDVGASTRLSVTLFFGSQVMRTFLMPEP